MNADIEVTFELFGSEAAKPSLLAQQLAPVSSTLHGGSAAGVEGAHWTGRALRVITDMIAVDSKVVIRRCAERAFDESDARVRGIAWCVLSEIRDDETMQDIVKATIADELKKRIPTSDASIGDDADVNHFDLLVSAAVMTASWAHTKAAIERECIESLAGSDAWAIESGSPAAIDFLNHPDSGRRLAALVGAARAGKAKTEVSEAIYKVMVCDPDPDVRVAAIITYGGMLRGSGDPECLRRLSVLVLDEQQPRWHRFVAYSQLFSVCGRPLSECPLRCSDEQKVARLRDGASDAEWPLAIEWEFVSRCAQKSKKSNEDTQKSNEKSNEDTQPFWEV